MQLQLVACIKRSTGTKLDFSILIRLIWLERYISGQKLQKRPIRVMKT
jgi:hypothetical protein